MINKENNTIQYQKRDLAIFGEEKAAEYLTSNGYTVICRNFRCKSGEIDIVASDKGKPDVIIFVEVKTRRNKSFGLPCEAVTGYKLMRIKRVIKAYAAIKRCANKNFRIDVIELLIINKKLYIRHLKNVG